MVAGAVVNAKSFTNNNNVLNRIKISRHPRRRRTVVEETTTTTTTFLSDDVFATDDPFATGGDDAAAAGDAAAAVTTPTVIMPTINVEKSIVEMIETIPEQSTFLAALKRANLLEELSGDHDGQQPYTIIIPSNDAFERRTSSTSTSMLDYNKQDEIDLLNKILWWPEWRLHLKDLLLHHVYRGSLPFETTTVMNMTNSSSSNGASSGSGGGNTKNNATTAMLLTMANGETVSLSPIRIIKILSIIL